MFADCPTTTAKPAPPAAEWPPLSPPSPRKAGKTRSQEKKESRKELRARKALAESSREPDDNASWSTSSSNEGSLSLETIDNEDRSSSSGELCLTGSSISQPMEPASVEPLAVGTSSSQTQNHDQLVSDCCGPAPQVSSSETHAPDSIAGPMLCCSSGNKEESLQSLEDSRCGLLVSLKASLQDAPENEAGVALVPKEQELATGSCRKAQISLHADLEEETCTVPSSSPGENAEEMKQPNSSHETAALVPANLIEGRGDADVRQTTEEPAGTSPFWSRDGCLLPFIKLVRKLRKSIKKLVNKFRRRPQDAETEVLSQSPDEI
jgi:hypothetical protein